MEKPKKISNEIFFYQSTKGAKLVLRVGQSGNDYYVVFFSDSMLPVPPSKIPVYVRDKHRFTCGDFMPYEKASKYFEALFSRDKKSSYVKFKWRGHYVVMDSKDIPWDVTSLRHSAIDVPVGIVECPVLVYEEHVVESPKEKPMSEKLNTLKDKNIQALKTAAMMEVGHVVIDKVKKELVSAGFNPEFLKGPLGSIAIANVLAYAKESFSLFEDNATADIACDCALFAGAQDLIGGLDLRGIGDRVFSNLSIPKVLKGNLNESKPAFKDDVAPPHMSDM
jgi:hypothetical protein